MNKLKVIQHLSLRLYMLLNVWCYLVSVVFLFSFWANQSETKRSRCTSLHNTTTKTSKSLKIHPITCISHITVHLPCCKSPIYPQNVSMCMGTLNENRARTPVQRFPKSSPTLLVYRHRLFGRNTCRHC